MQARYYDPQIGRFTQLDPVRYGPETFATGQSNRWTYCANDPVNASDPSGLMNWYGVFAGLSAIYAAIASGTSAMIAGIMSGIAGILAATGGVKALAAAGWAFISSPLGVLLLIVALIVALVGYLIWDYYESTRGCYKVPKPIAPPW